MIHPSYKELIDTINEGLDPEKEEPVLNSRYSLVIATSKRARQITSGAEPKVDYQEGEKALSVAVREFYQRKVNIVPGEDQPEEDAAETYEE